MVKSRLVLASIAAAAFFCLGMLVQWRIMKPVPAKLGSPTAAVRQKDGSLQLARQPDPAAKPAHQAPKGATLAAKATFTIQPHAKPSGASSASPSQGSSGSLGFGGANPSRDTTTPSGLSGGQESGSFTNSTITVDLSLFRLKDQTLTAVASSPDGIVTTGVFTPVSLPPTPRVRRNALGVLRTSEACYGLFYDRDLGPFRLGLAAYQEKERLINREVRGTGWMAKVGFTF